VRFADTSILLYAISRDPAEQDQAKRATDILAERDLALSMQYAAMAATALLTTSSVRRLWATTVPRGLR